MKIELLFIITNIHYQEYMASITNAVSVNVLASAAKKVDKGSINYFKKTFGCGRGKNDVANKVRENSIVMMLNKETPEEYRLHDPLWCLVADKVQICVDEMLTISGIDPEMVKYKKAAGRGKHHDFEAVDVAGNVLMNIEFKYGATQIVEAPQFVSPMKPSQYMSGSFEEFFYDTGLPTIIADTEFEIPDKDVWLAQLHRNKPPCMKMIQDKYYAGCKASSQFTGDASDILFYEKCKVVSNNVIIAFLSKDDVSLCVDILSGYFIQTQKKVYLMYKDGEFTHQRINPEEFVIDTCIKHPQKHRFVVTTKTGRTINILLRWKNGNGIAFPAFQISLVNR